MAMAMSMVDECHSPSLKDRLKSSICCFAAPDDLHESLDSVDDGNRRPQMPRSSYAWLKSRNQDLEIRDKCWRLIGRRGKNRRRYHSADFKYDSTSYSLNFDDDNKRKVELPLNNFMARLPVTPDRLPAVSTTRCELVAWT
ncbi:uncharacterized protein LOC110612148 [Manihot esculenta]|uniref:Uncharacterized protein n=1 Tax=Manihot esculenta TaxID=3983 RepID=A0A2C9W5Q8_MANES|nr:uncharacterized protein LOC110612148 [Manihot esculenta]OAY53638.1 hypothetical protein MANES_03G012100v8 [Manihot esculenta]